MTNSQRLLVGCAAIGLLAPAAPQAGETVTYTYDELGRLVKTVQSGTVNDGVETDIAYDEAGNRTGYDVSGSSGAADPGGTGATGGGNGSGGGGGTPPVFSIGDASVTEGGSLTFIVTKSGSVSSSYSVSYATANNTASAPGDYTAASGILTFGSSEASKTVTIATVDDSASELTETFFVNLSAPTGGATISDAQGTGTINDDDGGGGNSPPVTVPDTLSMSICDFFESVNVTANDSDPEGNTPLALVSEDSPHAIIATSSDIRFGPPPAVGTYTVNYVVADSLGATANGVLTVTVFQETCQ